MNPPGGLIAAGALGSAGLEQLPAPTEPPRAATGPAQSWATFLPPELQSQLKSSDTGQFHPGFGNAAAFPAHAKVPRLRTSTFPKQPPNPSLFSSKPEMPQFPAAPAGELCFKNQLLGKALFVSHGRETHSATPEVLN